MSTANPLGRITKILIVILLSFSLPTTKILAQNIGGIGAQLFLDTTDGFSMPRIMRLIPNTPAYDKLNATDYIISVNDVDCKNKTIEEVVALIRGEAGTTVKIKVADTKEGKNERHYELPRVNMQTGTPAPPPPDPLTAFYSSCENEVKQLKRSGKAIIKTYTSECGNYFFNFNADAAGTYHIRLLTMEEKAKDDTVQGFSATARVFDGANESAALALNKPTTHYANNMLVAQLEGDLSFNKSGVGVINGQIADDAKKCKGMYIVVYK